VHVREVRDAVSCTLPRLVAITIGRGIFDRFATELPNGDVEYRADLALYASAGVRIVLATSEDWPPTAIIATDDRGMRHLLQE